MEPSYNELIIVGTKFQDEQDVNPVMFFGKGKG